MSGQQIGTVVGAVVGSFIPVVGTALGAAIGGVIGGAIDPEQIKGPHIGEGNQQSSADGQPIAWILGTGPCVGNICDAGPRYEVGKTDDGKGGPEVTTYEAHQSFAILICESCSIRNSLITGIQMVKANGEIVYDIRPGSTMQAESAKWKENVTFYFGGEDPPIDPTLEAIHGVGNTPGFPGGCYAVFRDFNRSQYGDSIPTFEWLVVSDGTFTESEPAVLEPLLFDEPDPWPWVPNSVGQMDPRKSGVEYEYGTRDFTTGIYTWHASLSAALDDAFDNFSRPLISGPIFRGWTKNTVTVGGSSEGSTWAAFGTYNPATTDPNQLFDAGDDEGAAYIGLVYSRYVFGEDYPEGNYIVNSHPPSGWYPRGDFGDSGVRRPRPGSPDGWDRYFSTIPGDESEDIVCYSDIIIAVRPVESCVGQEENGTEMPDAQGYFVTYDGTVEVGTVCSGTTGSFKQLSLGTRAVFAGVVTESAWKFLPLGPIIVSGSADDNQTFWEAAYNAAVAAGDMPAGKTYQADGLNGDKFPRVNTDACSCQPPTQELTSGYILLSEIISRINIRGGLVAADFDVTELTDQVLGYPILSQYNAADTQRPALGAYFAFGSEYDDKIRYHKHGQASVLDVDPDDFIEGEEEVDDSKRRQAIEFPRKLYGTHYDPAMNFGIAKQPAERRSPDVRAIGEQTFQIPVCMEAPEAAQVTDKSLKVIWAKVNGTRKFSTAFSGSAETYLRMVPGMPITVEDRRYTADQLTISEGQIDVEASYDRQSAYTSDVEGSSIQSPTAPPSGLSGPTVFAAMNLPQLRPQDNVPGMYMAATGLISTWRGCELQMSTDGGATFNAVLQMTQRSVMGVLTQDVTDGLSSGSEPIYVQIYGQGTLSNATTTQLASGVNAFAMVSQANVSEITQFAVQDEETPNNYALTDITRGLLETVDTDHFIGEMFVLLDSVYFLPLSLDLAGETIIFRPVSYGSPAEKNPTYSVVFDPPTFVLDGGGA